MIWKKKQVLHTWKVKYVENIKYKKVESKGQIFKKFRISNSKLKGREVAIKELPKSGMTASNVEAEFVMIPKQKESWRTIYSRPPERPRPIHPLWNLRRKSNILQIPEMHRSELLGRMQI